MKQRAIALSAVVCLLLAGSLSAAEAPAVREVGEFKVLGKVDVPARAAAEQEQRAHWSRAAENFLRAYAARHGATGRESFNARSVAADAVGKVHVRVTQSIAGLPVVGAELIVHVEANTGNVVGVNGSFAADRGLSRQAALTASAALERALADYRIAGRFVGVPELTYVVGDDGVVRLAWSNLVSYENGDGVQLDRVFADAATGTGIMREPQISRLKSREVYDLAGSTVLTAGTLVRSEGNPPTGDASVNAAYDNSGIAYDYFKARHNRDSYDGAGSKVISKVHYGTTTAERDQAFWHHTEKKMYFGDGGQIWSNQVFSLDVVAHEFAHGVTRAEVTLGIGREPSSLDESLSDIFGAATEAYSDGSVNADVWKIGDGSYLLAGAVRYLNDPALNGHVDTYPERGSDSHSNAGIQNLAFYLLVQGGQHPRGDTTFSVASIGITAAEKIFYHALTAYLTSSTANYRMMRDYTLRAATDLYGLYSTQYNAVWNAWSAVGNNWTEHNGTLNTAGQSVVVSQYTTTTAGQFHTGHLYGNGGVNSDLFLERWDGATWVPVASGQSVTAREFVEGKHSVAGTFRWRVVATTGTGTYQLFVNRPK